MEVAAAAAAFAQTRPNAKSLPEWVEYEEFIERQLGSVGEENIKGLECTNSGNKINYSQSKFNNLLSGAIKSLYINYVRAPIEYLPQLPIFTNVFKDDGGHFLPYAHRVDGILTSALLSSEYNKAEPKAVDIYAGKYNADYDELYERNDRKNRVYLEKQSAAFLELLRLADEKPVLYLNFWKSPPYFHATSAICFKKDGVYNLCVYDPMYYYKPDKPVRPNALSNEYRYALECAYITYYLLAKKHGVTIKLVNLSELCPKKGTGQHCIQYLINAEYCSMYSLYFLYLYAKAGYPTELTEIQPVVNQTFMVPEPVKFTRVVCASTNIFKVKMMSFILTVLFLFVDKPEYKEVLKELNTNLESASGFKYVPPEVLALVGGRRARVTSQALTSSKKSRRRGRKRTRRVVKRRRSRRN